MVHITQPIEPEASTARGGGERHYNQQRLVTVEEVLASPEIWPNYQNVLGLE